MPLFKVEAHDDTMYIEAETQSAAAERLELFVGKIPPSMLKWETVAELPEGEELL